jgi:hypothetical protein
LRAIAADWSKWKIEFQGSKRKYEKIEESLGTNLKSFKNNMQEPCDSIKRFNLHIMGIEEG